MELKVNKTKFSRKNRILLFKYREKQNYAKSQEKFYFFFEMKKNIFDQSNKKKNL